jgi:hypothetical protein
MHPSTQALAFLDTLDCGASPHDMRRTMASEQRGSAWLGLAWLGLAWLGLDRNETKAILDHAKGAANRVLKRNRTSPGRT